MSEHDAGEDRIEQEMPPLVAAAHDALRAFILRHWLRPDGPPEQAQQQPES